MVKKWVKKDAICYGPSVISVMVTKGGHLRGGGTIGRGVSRVI